MAYNNKKRNIPKPISSANKMYILFEIQTWRNIVSNKSEGMDVCVCAYEEWIFHHLPSKSMYISSKELFLFRQKKRSKKRNMEISRLHTLQRFSKIHPKYKQHEILYGYTIFFCDKGKISESTKILHNHLQCIELSLPCETVLAFF